MLMNKFTIRENYSFQLSNIFLYIFGPYVSYTNFVKFWFPIFPIVNFLTLVLFLFMQFNCVQKILFLEYLTKDKNKCVIDLI